jgi:ABC-type dipeptide/oligopeptide/nickel transport system ATPase subunit
MTAMALCPKPDLIVFDEPTTALDVTTQIGVLKAIKEAIASTGVAALYITHDLAVVAQVADRIMVLRGGKMVELGTTRQIIEAPREDYTRALVSVRQVAHAEKPPREPLLTVEGITAAYAGGAVKVLRDVSVAVPPGQTLAVVGESGSGKSTLARVITGLLPPEEGTITFDGRRLAPALKDRPKEDLRALQMIYQMADVAMNPRQTVATIVGRPLEFYFGLRGAAKRARIQELLDAIELGQGFADRYPAELSGGQKQRVCIARALAAKPALIICDEVTSALDPLVADGILKLLLKLQEAEDVAYLFITHDLATVKAIADSVAVMYQGEVLRYGPKAEALAPPFDPYTDLLLASVPEMPPEGRRLARAATPTGARPTGGIEPPAARPRQWPRRRPARCPAAVAGGRACPRVRRRPRGLDAPEGGSRAAGRTGSRGEADQPAERRHRRPAGHRPDHRHPRRRRADRPLEVGQHHDRRGPQRRRRRERGPEVGAAAAPHRHPADLRLPGHAAQHRVAAHLGVEHDHVHHRPCAPPDRRDLGGEAREAPVVDRGGGVEADRDPRHLPLAARPRLEARHRRPPRARRALGRDPAPGGPHRRRPRRGRAHHRAREQPPQRHLPGGARPRQVGEREAERADAAPRRAPLGERPGEALAPGLRRLARAARLGLRSTEIGPEAAAPPVLPRRLRGRVSLARPRRPAPPAAGHQPRMSVSASVPPTASAPATVSPKAARSRSSSTTQGRGSAWPARISVWLISASAAMLNTAASNPSPSRAASAADRGAWRNATCST